jgi:hypothetical protein
MVEHSADQDDVSSLVAEAATWPGSRAEPWLDRRGSDAPRLSGVFGSEGRLSMSVQYAPNDAAAAGALDARARVSATLTMTFALPPDAFAIFLPHPEMVSQMNVERVLGLPQRTYLELLREPDCPLPVTPVGKLRLVDRGLLRRWLGVRGKARRVALPNTPAPDGDDVLPVEEQERLGIRPAPRKPTGRR